MNKILQLKKSVWTIINGSVTIMEMIFLMFNEYQRDFRDICPTSCFGLELEQIIRFWVLFVGVYPTYIAASAYFIWQAYKNIEKLK